MSAAPKAPARQLEGWLSERSAPDAARWLSETVEHARTRGADRGFVLGFSSAPRRIGREDLALGARDIETARSLRPGWQPERWTRDQAARTLLVLSLPSEDAAEYVATLDGLFENGDLGELIALYQSLPLLPHPDRFRDRAREGIRSNMKAVFEAVALDNPYPAEELPEEAFNQLVLKCLFVESPLFRVHGVDTRTNEPLARMLSDYAHERWAAARAVSPELWRCVGPVAHGPLLDDLRRVLASGSERERLAAALSTATNPRASALRSEFPGIFSRVDRAPPTWADLARPTS